MGKSSTCLEWLKTIRWTEGWGRVKDRDSSVNWKAGLLHLSVLLMFMQEFFLSQGYICSNDYCVYFSPFHLSIVFEIYLSLMKVSNS